eukprot:49663-Eustigmatos_ZCMA.PRE.1
MHLLYVCAAGGMLDQVHGGRRSAAGRHQRQHGASVHDGGRRRGGAAIERPAPVLHVVQVHRAGEP